MIENSFIFLSGVGEKTERQLWKRGVTSWDGYTNASERALPKRLRRHQERHQRHLDLARTYLDEGRLGPFGRWLPPNEAWRLFEAAGDDVLYLDIETTGYTYDQGGRTTVVGAHSEARGTTLLVRGEDLGPHRVQRLLDDARLLVTFNGKQFDVPFLKREFDVDIDGLAHLDLRFALKKVGITGGLKRIEQSLGIARPEEVAGMDGYEAVKLWKRWERGDENALETLLTYNREDVLNMEPLAHIAFDLLHDELYQPHVDHVEPRQTETVLDKVA